MMKSAGHGAGQAPRWPSSRAWISARCGRRPDSHRELRRPRCARVRSSAHSPAMHARSDERNPSVSVKIRLMRVGKKKQPTYRVVVADGRSPRDGRYIEIIGQYRPRQEPSFVEIDDEQALSLAAQGRPAHRAGAEAARERRHLGEVRGRAHAAGRHQAVAQRRRDRQGRSRREGREARQGRRRGPRPPAEAAASDGADEAAEDDDAPRSRPTRTAAEPDATPPTSDDADEHDVDDHDDDVDDEVGAEGNRIVGGRARRSSST